jgi:hypothetical protein
MSACPSIAGQKRTCPWVRVGLKRGQRGPAQQPTLRNVQWRLVSDLDIPRPSGNDLSMDQISPLPALTQDEVRVAAWAEVREPLELQLAPLCWRIGGACAAPW